MNYLKRGLEYSILCFFVLAIINIGAAPVYAESQLIRVSSDPWPPWAFGRDGEVATGGIAIDVAQELFKRLNLNADLRIFPYKRCLHQMKTGERDLLLMAKKTEEREKYMLFSDVVATDYQLIYYFSERMNDFKWQTWSDLKKYTVGIVEGFNYGDFEAAARRHGIAIEFVEFDDQNIRKLLAGRVDLIILNRSTASHYFKKNPENGWKLKAASKSISESKFYFALSKKSKAKTYLPAINAVLKEMKADGTLDQLLRLSE